jgi:pimeloyl-ACP methyl ester carboxylesterase
MSRAGLLGAIAAGALLAAGAWLYTPDLPRAALESRYATPPSRFVQVAGLRLHLRDTGPRDAPAVVLLHGFGASLHSWDGWAAGLEDRWRVLRYDLPGFGLTGADPTSDYSDARGLAVLAALLEQLGIQRAALVGHSMGGKLAWMFAAAQPDRVVKLVLVAPDGFASPGFEYNRAPEVPLLLRVLPYTLPRFMVRMSLAPAYGDPARMTEAALTSYRDLLLAPGVRRAMLARLEQVRLVPPEPLLARISAPTLLVWGGRDAMIPATNAADYQRSLRESELASFPALGHLLHEEAPAETLVPVRAFLAR